jgi:hypothetical protein
LLALQGCFAERTEHPLAALHMAPSAVCLEDDFTTEVHLDAAASQAKAHLPGSYIDDGHCVTHYAWSVTGSPYEIESGALECEFPCPCDDPETCVDDCPLTITLEGVHTATVTLEVRNDLGETDLAIVPVALVAAQPCEDDTDCCPPASAGVTCQEACEDTPSGTFCAPLSPCLSDADCPACFGCTADGRCWHTGLLP